RAIGRAAQQIRPRRRACGEQRAQRAPKSTTFRRGQTKKPVELGLSRSFARRLRVALQNAGSAQRCEVQNLLSNSDAAARSCLAIAEDAQRQVLNGEVRVVFGRGDPTPKIGRMRFVERWHVVLILVGRKDRRGREAIATTHHWVRALSDRNTASGHGRNRRSSAAATRFPRQTS